MTQEELFKKLVAHCKEYGFVFPSSEIYDGLGAVYDYGQNGVELKNNIKRYWWDSMVKLHENIVGLDAAIFMHPRTWEASGHVGAFNDPLIDNKDSKKRYRADVLIEDWLAKQDEKVEKEVEKARKRFGEAFDEARITLFENLFISCRFRLDFLIFRFGICNHYSDYRISRFLPYAALNSAAAPIASLTSSAQSPPFSHSVLTITLSPKTSQLMPVTTPLWLLSKLSAMRKMTLSFLIASTSSWVSISLYLMISSRAFSAFLCPAATNAATTISLCGTP